MIPTIAFALFIREPRPFAKGTCYSARNSGARVVPRRSRNGIALVPKPNTNPRTLIITHTHPGTRFICQRKREGAFRLIQLYRQIPAGSSSYNKQTA